MKRYTLLTLIAGLLLTGAAFGASQASSASSTGTSMPPPKTSIKSTVHKTSHHATAHAPTIATVRRVSSFGNPGAGDNAAADDPIVRRAALEALGNLSGSIVVVEPNTGRILSIVNQKLALGSGFTPCSTFKPMVALAALREGIITPNTKLFVSEHVRMDVNDALARSNNTFFHKLGEMLGFKRLSEYAHEFGLGEKAGFGIPGESPGVFPTAPPKDGGVGHLAYCGTDVQATALQMAAIISAIANGGTLYALQYPRTSQELAEFQPIVRRRMENLAPYIPQIRDGLAGSVLYGTGRLAYDPGMAIYGKTGTCSEDGAHLGWFISFSGGLQAHYVTVVLLRGGQTMYGPHAAEIAGRFYRDLTQFEHPAQASREGILPLTSQR